jgi:fatty acid-binding protein DegV
MPGRKWKCKRAASHTTNLLFPLNNSVCILTDGTAQFPHGAFPGQRLIKILPLPVDKHLVHVPPLEDFLRTYRELENEFGGILVLTLSNHILPVAQAAQKAALQHGGTAKITVLDSMQTGAGLGMLAQLGAQAILAGATLNDVEEHLRAAIASIYTLIHIDTVSLARAIFAPPQTNSVETGLLPLLTLDDGQFAPYKKIRTRRHLLESFQEFIEEFETPKQIVCMSGRDSAIRSRSLREIAAESFPKVPFIDLEMPAPLASLFGPETIGITVMEQTIS